MYHPWAGQAALGALMSGSQGVPLPVGTALGAARAVSCPVSLTAQSPREF